MRIVFNTDQIYLHGGIEKVMATKANYWANLPNVEVYIITTEQHDFLPRYELHPQVKRIDLGINYNRSESYISWYNIQEAIRHFKKQKTVLRMLKPDVVISANFNFDHFWLPFIKGKSRLIKERHNSRFFEAEERKKAGFFWKIQNAITTKIDGLYNHIIVLNPDEATYVKTNNAVVIPNPVEASVHYADMDSKKVVAAGRISPVKNFAELINAWILIKDEFPDWQLDIYGEDYLGTQQKLEALIIEHSLQDFIHFKGSVSNMLKIMEGYSIYAMTSETECFPMVLLEAMSIGLPIVSYDCPNGPRHIVENGEDAYLVVQGDTEALAMELKSLMRSPKERKRLQHNARNNSSRFHTKTVMALWADLLNLPDV